MAANLTTNIKKFIVLSAALLLGTDIIAQQQLKKQFENPPIQYRPVPFWHLNGQLTTEVINKQVTDAGKAGFGGVAVLPVTPGKQHPTGLPSPGMTPEYLSKDYFDRYNDILISARKNGLKVILYDDVDFPSGSAGGKLKQYYPGATRKILIKTDTLINGPAIVNTILPKGSVMAIVATQDNNIHRTDLTAFAKNGSFKWDVPQGKWKIMFFTCQNGGDNIVDYMDPEAVKRLVTLTYDEYARRFSSYFGNVITQTFYDDVGYVFKERGWALNFNEKFKKHYGKDPAIYYPALWEDIGPETQAARVAFFNTRAELLAEGFPKIISKWDDTHGLKSSGHPPGNYEIQPVDMNFDIFKFYRYSHIPTMDAIFYHGHGREGYKLVSSAATAYDKPITASETYGAFLEKDFDVKMLYCTAMELFARGINFLVPHGMWYDPKPQSVRIPPLVSPYSEKIGPALPDYNNFAARTSMMLQGGRQVSDIGVIYPIAALEGFYHFQAKDNPGVGKYVSKETDYLKISDLLTNQIHRDFTFIHPELFTKDQYLIKNGEILLKNKVDKQSYKIMILPGGDVISYYTLKKLEHFYNRGGKIIATSLLPSKSAEFGLDSGVRSIIREIFNTTTATVHTNKKGGIALFIPNVEANQLSAAINKMEIHPDIIFDNNPSPNTGNGSFSYIHKIKNGKNIYYFANSTNDVIDTYATMRGKIIPEIWDPNTGQSYLSKNYTYISIKGKLYTRLKLNLHEVQSVFIVDKLLNQSSNF
jgi:hypothetical protein